MYHRLDCLLLNLDYVVFDLQLSIQLFEINEQGMKITSNLFISL